ncbi:MAG: SLC13 family permease [Actinomycetota bacterium]|nr:SLC13 family permease [Actinomycetota bacterium]
MSTAELAELAGRVLPVLGFLVAITVVAEASDLAGVFDVAAHWAARAGRSRVWALWLLVVALACVCTIVLSLDTTAVLLTPVAVTVARQVGLPPLPFAMTTLWLANTASLLLPVSNLTNLLALHRLDALGVGQAGYLRLAWAPALAAIAATVALLAVRHRKALSGTYAAPSPPQPHDRALLLVAGACCLALGPAFVAGLTPWIPSSVAAVVLLVTLLVRDRSMLQRISVPWPMVIGVSVLFVAVQLALDHGLRDLLASLVGTGGGAGALFRVGAVGALAGNVVNNLPAYLAVESVSSDAAARLVALLVGVDVGPLVTVWASLATLLWRQRCRSAGLEVSPSYLAREGLLCAAVAVAAALGALALVT